MSNNAYRIAWATAAVLCAAYGLTLLHLAPLALQDYPNHLARAVVMNDLLFHDGATFGAAFQYDFLAVPYILNDWLLSFLIELTGAQNAAAAWPVLIALSLPCALLYFMRILTIRREEQVIAFLLSLYLATNTFLLRGFLAFSLAVAAILVVLGLIYSIRERARPGVLLYLAYCAALMAAYLVHLTTLVFVTAAFSVTAVLRLWQWPEQRRSVGWRKECQLFAPIAALLIWHFLFHHAVPGLGATGDTWGSVLGKFQHLNWDFIRFTRRTDFALLCIGLLCCAWQAYWLRNFRAPSRLVQGMALLTLTFLGIYFALPSSLGNTTWVDMRALPMVCIFLMLACFAPPDSGRAAPRATVVFIGFAAAAVLALANLIYLASHLHRLQQRVSDYREVIAEVPRGSWVFPVYTSTTDRPIKSTLHLASFALIDRQALTPYLFSRNLGDPMEYFSYRNKPYAPDEDWYTDTHSDPVDWQAIAQSYDFVLVMKPYDAARIPLRGSLVFENSAAALLAIGARASVSSQSTAH